MFNFTLKIVSVTFFDEATSTPIFSVRMPLDRLPETFTTNTALKMNGAEYIVTGATPQTKAEFARTKQLKVALRKRIPSGGEPGG